MYVVNKDILQAQLGIPQEVFKDEMAHAFSQITSRHSNTKWRISQMDDDPMWHILVVFPKTEDMNE